MKEVMDCHETTLWRIWHNLYKANLDIWDNVWKIDASLLPNSILSAVSFFACALSFNFFLTATVLMQLWKSFMLHDFIYYRVNFSFMALKHAFAILSIWTGKDTWSLLEYLKSPLNSLFFSNKIYNSTSILFMPCLQIGMGKAFGGHFLYFPSKCTDFFVPYIHYVEMLHTVILSTFTTLVFCVIFRALTVT